MMFSTQAMMFRRFPPRFRLRTLLIGVTLVALGFGAWANWEYLPGTYYRDDRGFPHGTGVALWYYDSGALMIKEWYRAGVPTKSTWYLPDGSEVATRFFDRKKGGEGFYLREDGSVRVKHQYKYSPADRTYLAHGPATYFTKDGSVEKTVEFRDGSPVGG